MNLKRSLLRLVVFLATLGVTVLVTFYLTHWLEEDIELTYLETNSSVAAIGQSELTKDLIAEITKLEYRETPYESIRVINYVLENEDSRSVKEILTFYFFGQVKEEKMRIDNNAVIDIVSTHMVKRIDDTEIGPGFTIVSTFPGKSKIPVTLVLNVKDYPDLNNMKVVMEPSAGPITVEEKKEPRTYSLTFGMILIIVFISAAAYSILWMLINVKVFKTHTAGARTFDWIFRKIGLPGFLPKDQETK